MQANLAVDLQRLERTLLKASDEQQRRGSLVVQGPLAPSIERPLAPARDDGEDGEGVALPPPLCRQSSAPASEMAPVYTRMFVL